MEKVINVKQLTEEEFSVLKTLNSSTQDLIIKFGQVEYQNQLLINQKQEIIKELESLRIQEIKYGQDVQNKYGQVSINIETGEITTTD